MAVIRLYLEVDAESSHVHEDFVGELKVTKIRRSRPSRQVREESGATWIEVAIHIEDMAFFRGNQFIKMDIDADEVITVW